MNVAAMVLLLAVTAIWLTRPLWRARAQRSVVRRSLNVNAYEQRLEDIETELGLGTLGEAEASQLREEAAARLLDDTAKVDSPVDEASSPRYWGLSAAIVLVLCVAVSLGYFVSDTRKMSAWVAESGKDPQAVQQLVIGDMVGRLEKRLESEPEDADGWAMLGRSYFVLNRYPEAAKAYARANVESAAPQADWLAAEGEVRAFMAEGDLQGAPRRLFEAALDADPSQPMALWYGGLTAVQNGEFGLALDRWLALRRQNPPADFIAVLDERLPELARMSGRSLPDEMQTAPAGLSVTFNVQLAPELINAVADPVVLLVFARRPEGGPPLAVVRQPYTIGNGPIRVVLDDASAMIQGNTLSSAEQWEIVARLSRSGGAQAQPGDLEGRLSMSRDQAAEVQTLAIDRQLP